MLFRSIATLRRGLVETLTSGLIATVRSWVDLARRLNLDDGILLFAEAEVALRERDNRRATALGERAAQLLSGDLSARAYLAAARGAHLDDDPREAQRLSELGLAHAVTDEVRIAALWTEFASAMEEVDTRAPAILDRLRAFTDSGTQHHMRVLTAEGFLLSQGGDVRAASSRLELARALVSQTDDPFARTTLLHHLAYVERLQARYEESLAISDAAATEGRETGLAFVVDHALLQRAGAYAGMRKFRQAHTTLSELERRAKSAGPFVNTNVVLQRAKLAIFAGDLSRAEKLLDTLVTVVNRPAFHGEVRGFRAIVAAAAGDHSKARRALDADAALFEFVESRALRHVAHTIMAARGMGASPGDATAHLTDLFRGGELDAVVIGYRAYPALLQIPLEQSLRDQTIDLLARSRDFDIARAAGLRISRESRPRQTLSSREQEVYELLIQGLANREIASALFISESTTKVHVRHIFEKLGVHSRAEAARMAAELDRVS